MGSIADRDDCKHGKDPVWCRACAAEERTKDEERISKLRSLTEDQLATTFLYLDKDGLIRLILNTRNTRSIDNLLAQLGR
jgi:hypothetical protein